MDNVKPSHKNLPHEILGRRDNIPVYYYSKYLNEGQDILLSRVPLHGTENQLDSLSGTLVECLESLIQIRLHYRLDVDETYPFFPGMPFAILADCYGVGLRFTALFEERLDNKQILLKPHGNLELFFRRQYLRTQTSLWLCCVRSTESLRTLRRTWKKHSSLLQAGHTIDVLPPVARKEISLGAGGLQLLLEAPVNTHEICLVYFDLPDKRPLVCAICETVCVDKPDENGFQRTRLEFRNIADSDRQRIVRFVNRSIKNAS